ncbi:hypothetical protein B0H17DRAFT_1038601 [Mycena rosella]|uniref:Uncharacterized protein n=1 Tax=Mycena rosella TaxID=1033263 RepID=A0AAD7GT73_MYCRO|nr:hypothetical protein B0H17DRAFT_1038601 [Mycena rosella]
MPAYETQALPSVKLWTVKVLASMGLMNQSSFVAPGVSGKLMIAFPDAPEAPLRLITCP